MAQEPLRTGMGEESVPKPERRHKGYHDFHAERVRRRTASQLMLLLLFLLGGAAGVLVIINLLNA
jgi:hypothetical protein